jgi:hypothetical protein
VTPKREFKISFEFCIGILIKMGIKMPSSKEINYGFLYFFFWIVKKATAINSPDAKRMIAFVIELVGFVAPVNNANINQRKTIILHIYM